MKPKFQRFSGRAARWVTCLLLLASGCGNSGTGPSGSASPGSGGTGSGGVGAGAGGSGVGATSSSVCNGEAIAMKRRLVRLTLRQTVASLQELLPAALAEQVAVTFQVPALEARAFPPLSSQEEGAFITEGLWAKSESIAKTAAQFVRDNYQAVTGCQPADATDACATAFIASFSERAFRRPLDEQERTSLLQVFTESKAVGAGVAEATQHVVWAILSSPHFVYRRELGAPSAGATAPTALTNHELATALSFFLVDGPPDAALLDAAKSERLSSADGVGVEVDRLLATPQARTNLQQAVFAYFGIGNLDAVIIDPEKAPTFTVGLKNAMFHETQEFIGTTLFGGPVEELLTSRKTIVNPDLAALYGIPFPGQSTAADNFVPVELPASRAGLLTQAGFLAARARPDKDSVVARGLLVAATMLCAQNPDQPPDGLKDQIAAVSTQLADKTEREKSEYRLAQANCGICHRNFDAYGLVLQNFDLIGAYRSTDELGRPIDASATLPADAGGELTPDAAGLGRALASSGAFTTCMTRNLMKYALAEGNVNRDDCAVQEVSRKVLAGPRTFASLVREIAVSKTFGNRSAEVQP